MQNCQMDASETSESTEYGPVVTNRQVENLNSVRNVQNGDYLFKRSQIQLSKDRLPQKLGSEIYIPGERISGYENDHIL